MIRKIKHFPLTRFGLDSWLAHAINDIFNFTAALIPKSVNVNELDELVVIFFTQETFTSHYSGDGIDSIM